MSYPVILNGDHAEFEREHANMPPHERPDWPLPSFDARDWAKAFMKIKDAGAVVDEEWMTTWFANALMRGYDEHVAHSRARYEALMGAAKILPSMLFDYGDDDVRREAYAAIAALRSAGIEETR